jgi:uncharacterized membrane protein HdeD (DUF308 family)
MEQTKLSGWTRAAYILIGILYAITGLYLFLYPSINVYSLGWVLGISLIVYGIFKVFAYFTYGSYKQIFRYELIVGILMIIFGIILVMNIGSGMNFLGILTGIALLVDAALRVYFSFEAKKEGISGWWTILVMAVITGICACLFLFNPSMSGVYLTMLIGAIFLSSGLSNLFFGIFAL